MHEIRLATVADIAVIQELAEITWWPTYESIVGAEQVRYMLNAFYSAEVIGGQMQEGSQTYLLLLDEGRAVGFAAFSPRTENAEVYKLHKLYCLPAEQGRGYGRTLLATVEKEVMRAGKSILELNVNRYNKAKEFYEHMGFTVAYEEDIDIGRGFFMNDYVMRKELQPVT